MNTLYIFISALIVTTAFNCTSSVDSEIVDLEIVASENISESEEEIRCWDPECYRDCTGYCNQYPASAFDSTESEDQILDFCGYGNPCWKQCCE